MTEAINDLPNILTAYEADGGAQVWFYCKGHVPISLFVSACREYDDSPIVNPKDVKFAFVRNIPTKDDGYDMPYRIEFCKQGRGAYPITFTEEWDYEPLGAPMFCCEHHTPLTFVRYETDSEYDERRDKTIITKTEIWYCAECGKEYEEDSACFPDSDEQP